MSGFMTGFADQMANIMADRRQQKAQEQMMMKEQAMYFNKEAFAEALRRRQERDAEAQALSQQADYLVARGANEEVVMAVASGGAESLANFRAYVEEVEAKKGRNLTPEEINGMVKVYKNTIPEGTTLDQFMESRKSSSLDLNPMEMDFTTLNEDLFREAYAPITGGIGSGTQYAIDQAAVPIPKKVDTEEQQRYGELFKSRVQPYVTLRINQLNSEVAALADSGVRPGTPELAEYKTKSDTLNAAKAALDSGDVYGAALIASPETIEEIALEIPEIVTSAAIPTNVRGYALAALINNGFDDTSLDIADSVKEEATRVLVQQDLATSTPEDRKAKIAELVAAGRSDLIPPQYISEARP